MAITGRSRGRIKGKGLVATPAYIAGWVAGLVLRRLKEALLNYSADQERAIRAMLHVGGLRAGECGSICTISKPDVLRAPMLLSHYIRTHPQRTLAEVTGMVEICDSVRKKRPDAVDRPASKSGVRCGRS